MAYDLTCDTCEFSQNVDAETDAYLSAKDHESEYPNHFVFIYSDE